jgi:DNA glycosylase AlkZ-like
MRLTDRQLNRATLARQLLLERASLGVVDAVRRVVALQAQEPASPYLALWNRLADFDAAELDEAFAKHAIVKAPLMRITLHAVDRGDYPDFHHAMQVSLRASRLHDRRFKGTGLSIADADALVPFVLDFASQPRSKEEIETMLGERLGAPPDRYVWWALRTFAPVIHAPTGGAWSFGTTPVYMASPVGPTTNGEESVQRLIVRYLEGFGPASMRDFGQFAMLRNPTTHPAFAALADTLVMYEAPDGSRLYDVPGAPLPDEDTPTPPRLLGMWDSVLLAYTDRSRVIPEEYRRVVIQRNGDVLSTVLVDGYVAGVWRPVEQGIEVLAFHSITGEAWDALAVEAGGLVAMLADRESDPYSRYARWWSGLPEGDTRILDG